MLANTFREALIEAKAAHPHGKQLHVYDLDEYADMRLWLTPSGRAGCAVTQDKDLVSVFRHPECNDSLMPVLTAATLEARTLDCFDVNGFLPSLYRELGWFETSRVAFDPDLKPDGWDVETDGRPDVVLMLNSRYMASSMGRPKPFKVQRFDSWDEASSVREALCVR